MTTAGMRALDERVLRELADRAEIHDVLLRYCRGADRLDAELIRSAYHPDAVDDHGKFLGSAGDFAEWVVGVMRETSISTQHTLPNVLIEFDGDVAGVETSFVAYHRKADPDAESGERIEVFGGRYLDRFERRSGQWRIAERTVAHDWSTVLHGAQFPRREEYVQGRRDRGDAVYRLVDSDASRRAHRGRDAAPRTH
ncbi:nuclear transport factor 2 family protein [uncultured Jatrophihabitans sp.]|uniref:nuclear transport factor 2 family protein n=1 Tax=uncultured Jatrophihabitans sp. TaxID=1610747 RepID=UPI0035CA06BC